MKNKAIRVISTLFAIILTAKIGTIEYNGHTETWYDLPMENVIQRSQAMGIPCEYWVRDDGVKMFGPWVIVAAHPSKTRYTFIKTSLGMGIILDTHKMSNTELYDIATAWQGGK